VKSKKVKGKKTSLKIIGVIPARYASTRFPGKPLADIIGKPMIQHVYESAAKSKLLSEVIIATDDKRIFNAVKEFGANVVMTSTKHQSGTDRIGEVVKIIKCDIAVNIQGDEPFIDYRNIDKAIEPLIKDKSIKVSTICYRITNKSEIQNPNIVKVVFDKDNFALYFSRSTVPYDRDNSNSIRYYKHIGLYVYRKDYLLKLIKLKPTKLETAEKLEQLRILEAGEKIKVVETKIDSHSVDTKEDLKKIKKYA
jgi:3-deoxy-manno-octulosonate cytidylyltransferase (CMP-KDO synthetase)